MRTYADQPADEWAWPWERLQGGRWVGRLALALLLLAWAWVLARWPLTWAAALLVGCIVGVAVLVKPALGLPLLALAVPFGSVRSVSLGGASIGLAELLLGAIAAAWLARQFVRRSLALKWPFLASAGLVLLVAMLVSFLPATSPMLAAKELVKWVELWVAVLLVVNVAGAVDVVLLAVGLLLAGAAEGLVGLYQVLTGSGPTGFLLGQSMRASGTFGQPNPFGGYLGLTIPLAVGIALTAWPARGEEAGRWQRMALGLLAVIAGGLMLGGLFASWSRGAWLGAATTLAIVVLARGGAWLRGTLAAALVGAMLVFLILGRLPIPGALEKRFADFAGDLTTFDVRSVEITDANFAVVERVAHWQAAWGMFSAHPWTGVGIGNYPAVYGQYALPRWQEPLGHAHNYYLNIAAEAGIPGLAAYLLWVGASLWLAVRAVRASRGLWLGLALGALGMWVHLTVHNMFDNLYVHGMGIHVGLLLGLAAWVVANGYTKVAGRTSQDREITGG